ncbi:MAG: hypothetical protein Q9167_000720 [Letrouitia subvulpina]
MALDSGHPYMANPPLISNDKPYQTPSGPESRESSHRGWYSPFPLASSTPLYSRAESSDHRHNEAQGTDDGEGDFGLDPKRFTPTLHASLVSEILSLRRDAETKNSALADLEENLHNCRRDNGQLSANVASQEKELRSARKQMQLLENGTLSALGDLAKERDSAVASLTEMRKRLEATKITVRTKEEEVQRNEALWTQDKQNWDNERRVIERKAHVAEGRLKAMIAEVAAVQNKNRLSSAATSDLEEGAGETWFSNWSDIISTRSSSVRGPHHLSEISHNTYDSNELANLRASVIGNLNSTERILSNNLSLADELDYEEDHDVVEFADGVVSPDALPEENPLQPRRFSNHTQDQKARRVLGLLTEANEQILHEEPVVVQKASAFKGKPSDPNMSLGDSSVRSQDVGTQYSPPSSPKLVAQARGNVEERQWEKPGGSERAANQSRKRVSLFPAFNEQTPFRKADSALPLPMVSTACQTVEQVASPTLIPVIALESPQIAGIAPSMSLELRSTATQTVDAEQETNETANNQDHPSVTIPIITIHPPGSRPTSSHNNVVLPPRTKNVACQVSIEQHWSSNSVSVQTEEIRVDKRPLPILSRPMSAATEAKPQRGSTYYPQAAPTGVTRTNLKDAPPVDPSRPRRRPNEIKICDPSQGNTDEQSSNIGSTSGSRLHVSSQIALPSSSDQNTVDKDIDFSDDDDFANIAPIRKTLSKVQNSWKLIPTSVDASSTYHDRTRPISDIQELEDDKLEIDVLEMQVTNGGRPAVTTSQAGIGAQGLKGSTKDSEIRRAALMSRGGFVHTRQRSPSAPGVAAVPPPFPVPTRSSSRKPPKSVSEGAGSPTPLVTSFITAARPRPQPKPPAKNPLRKVRSAAAVPKFARTRSHQDDTQSSTIASPNSTPLLSPRFPQISRSESTPQCGGRALQDTPDQEPSSIGNVLEPSIESPRHTISVVDAIAQTMVGEWMWKYVRKRKSFGITDPPQVEFDEARSNSESNGGIRHKRWVWLAPYERAVMWSNKQPTSGSALLGKNGRKLSIQSVLDVRDDNPMPKNSGVQSTFGRSILILTPERALKFTATSRQRHFIWLTALSFLSHSTMAMEDLTAIPPVPQQEHQLPPSQRNRAGMRRSPRDSIQIAKTKERPSLKPRHFTSPVGIVQTNKTLDDGGFEEAEDPLSDAAEAPQIPRVSDHARKRSNTGPRPSLQNTFQSFSAGLGKGSGPSFYHSTPLDASASMTRGLHNPSNAANIVNRRTINSTKSQVDSPRDYLLDAAGTVRMEAFVDHRAKGPIEQGQASKSLPRSSYRTRQGRKKDLRYWGVGEENGNDAVAPTKTEGRLGADDPFKGF